MGLKRSRTIQLLFVMGCRRVQDVLTGRIGARPSEIFQIVVSTITSLTELRLSLELLDSPTTSLLLKNAGIDVGYFRYQSKPYIVQGE